MAFKSVWVGERLERLIREYPLRGTDPLFAQELGVSRAALKAHAIHLKLRSLVTNERIIKGVRRALGKSSEEGLDLNRRYFDTWSNNMAWTLGYTFADGSVRSSANGSGLRYSCKLDDVELLEIVKGELRSDHHIATHYKTNGRRRATLEISCSDIAVRIQELHGVLPRKSYKDIPYPFVPDDFLGHFSRGVLDGDGSIPTFDSQKRGGFYWCGTKLFITGLMEHLSFITDIPMATILPCRKIFRFYWSDRQDVIKLYHLIYPEGEYPYLKRKRDRIEEVLRNQGLL
jgi:hypothetical protein